jgi:hypothetical protein
MDDQFGYDGAFFFTDPTEEQQAWVATFQDPSNSVAQRVEALLLGLKDTSRFASFCNGLNEFLETNPGAFASLFNTNVERCEVIANFFSIVDAGVESAFERMDTHTAWELLHKGCFDAIPTVFEHTSLARDPYCLKLLLQRPLSWQINASQVDEAVFRDERLCALFLQQAGEVVPAMRAVQKYHRNSSNLYHVALKQCSIGEADAVLENAPEGVRQLPETWIHALPKDCNLDALPDDMWANNEVMLALAATHRGHQVFVRANDLTLCHERQVVELVAKHSRRCFLHACPVEWGALLPAHLKLFPESLSFLLPDPLRLQNWGFANHFAPNIRHIPMRARTFAHWHSTFRAKGFDRIMAQVPKRFFERSCLVNGRVKKAFLGLRFAELLVFPSLGLDSGAISDIMGFAWDEGEFSKFNRCADNLGKKGALILDQHAQDHAKQAIRLGITPTPAVLPPFVLEELAPPSDQAMAVLGDSLTVKPPYLSSLFAELHQLGALKPAPKKTKRRQVPDEEDRSECTGVDDRAEPRAEKAAKDEEPAFKKATRKNVFGGSTAQHFSTPEGGGTVLIGGLHFAGTTAVAVQQHNPKKYGTTCHDRYEEYKLAITVRDLLEYGATLGDVQNDYLRGYITFA